MISRQDQQCAYLVSLDATDLPRSCLLVVSNPCSRHSPSGSSWPLDRSFRNTDLASFAFANRFLLAIRAYDRSSNQPSESSGELYLYRHLPERTLVPSRTVALEEETTNMRPVPLVLRILPGHILQHLFGRRGSELGIVSVCHLARRGVGHLPFHDLCVELCGSEGEVGGIGQKGLLGSREKKGVDSRLLISDVGAVLTRPNAASLT